MTRTALVLGYLGAIVVANLTLAEWGREHPEVALYNAFVLVGLDLVARDLLHSAWSRGQLVRNMGLLIAAGERVPWQRIDALFIGGSTEFKMGHDAAELAREARVRGKHVHWGRVSSLRRLRYIASVGGYADSCDGNINNRWRTTYLDRNVGAAAALAQGRLVP